MEILVTLNESYLPPLQVMLTSLHLAHPGQPITLHLMHSGIPEESLEAVGSQCGLYGIRFSPIRVDDDLFEGAPVSAQYPRQMYYRLLAPRLLPRQLHRVLYLDPDVLILNSLLPLWQMDLEGKLFAAASHKGKAELASGLNQARLGTEGQYFNSGVLLEDLNEGRRQIRPQEIFRYAREHKKELLLPDQDILNALYGDKTLPLDDTVWNYDARNFSIYLFRSGGACTLDWVMQNTEVLHFCGRAKPWQAGYFRRFGVLYKHYIQLTRRTGLYLGK